VELRVEDLAVARGGQVALAGLSFALAGGEALVLRGPNGVGKTTLLRTLAGLQPAVAGRISIPPESLAYASHADGLKATLTVAENLRFWAALHGLAEIGPAVEAMDLGALTGRRAANLSAGQKRRLGLARLLVTGRPVWLLDEPTVSLDAASVALFAGAVRGHLAGGGAAIMATHIDLGLAEARVLDLAPYRPARGAAAAPTGGRGFDAAFGEAVG
jgi:heme exporter protein A